MNYFSNISNTKKGILTIFAAFLMHFNLGSIYSSGLISPYLISYLHSYNEGIHVEDGFWYYPSAYITMSLTCFFGVYIEKRLGARV